MKKILVTGDRGYIGSTLVPLLLEKNYLVRGFDTHFFKDILTNKENKYKRITKDIRHVTEDDVYGVEAVIHLSALSNDPMGDIAPKLTEEINFRASIRLAKLSKKLGVKRFIFSSSCSIYGISKSETVDEESGVNPLTEYAKSKLKTEKELKKLADNNFCVAIMRNSTVYGFSPVFRNDLVVNNLLTCALANNKIEILSDGTPWRPLIDVRDLSNAFIVFLEADSEKINRQILNIGFNKNNFQVKDIASEVKKAISGCEIVYMGEHGKDSRSYKVSFDKFEDLFPEFKQKWGLSKSINDMKIRLKDFHYSKKDFDSDRFVRLKILKDLLAKEKIDRKLYWVN